MRLSFGVLYCIFVIAHDRRRILHCNVTKHPTSAWVIQQLREAFPYDSAPGYLIFDHGTQFYERIGQWDRAIADLELSAQYANQLSYWRGVTQVDGLLAKAFLHEGAFQPALVAINEAIEANKRIPDELYFVPRNLGIKAEILARLGDKKSSNELYEKSADVFDALLSKVPTPSVERQLLNDLSAVYAGYFTSLSDQGRTDDAFRAIERARGRVEAQGLMHHEIVPPHEPSTAEQNLTKLNIRLLNTDDSATRARILEAIYSTEQQLDTPTSSDDPPPGPVALGDLQHELTGSELLLEYVLDDPNSYVLAVTRNSVHQYTLRSREMLEQETTQYRSTLKQEKTDPSLAQRLYDGLLAGIPELKDKHEVIVVPDGKLHLLPFSALINDGQYVLTSHLISVVPSGTVLSMLRHRSDQVIEHDNPYVGVAAWISKTPPTTLLAIAHRAMSGPERSQLVALPESRHEVETIATDLPKPSTIRIQRHTGRPKEACWRLIIQHGIKGRKEHQRWTESELEIVREELVKSSIEEVAKKINRTPKAIRNMLRRNHISLRDIRCDLFSVESLAAALHVRKSEVIFWIEHAWLQASITERGRRRFYTITPEALKDLYKHHHRDLMQRGMRNLTLFEAYVEYCFAPKHTVGEQLLDVRRDKKERAAFAAAGGEIADGEDDDDEDDAEMDGRYRVEMASTGPGADDGDYDG